MKVLQEVLCDCIIMFENEEKCAKLNNAGS